MYIKDMTLLSLNRKLVVPMDPRYYHQFAPQMLSLNLPELFPANYLSRSNPLFPFACQAFTVLT